MNIHHNLDYYSINKSQGTEGSYSFIRVKCKNLQDSWSFYHHIEVVTINAIAKMKVYRIPLSPHQSMYIVPLFILPAVHNNVLIMII